MDALFGFLARNDAEWTKRELLGRTWRRDWAMRQFRLKKRFFGGPEKIMGIGCSGYSIVVSAMLPGALGTHPELPGRLIRQF